MDILKYTENFYRTQNTTKLPAMDKLDLSSKFLRDSPKYARELHSSFFDSNDRQKERGISKNNNNQRFNIDQPDAKMEYARLQDIFLKAYKDNERGLDKKEFKEAIENTVGHHLSEDEIGTLFMKVDANCDGVVDWEEYITYNVLQCQEKNLMTDMMREKPFPLESRGVHSRHRDIIVRIAFLPATQKRTFNKTYIDYTNGRYVSLSKEGTVTIWSLNMRSTKSFMTHRCTDRTRQPWLTDMACMYNVNMLAVTSTNMDITIFDLHSNKFQKRYYITAIESCITTLTYWADPENLNRAVMAWGDTSGNVFILEFNSALRGGPFGAVSGKNSFKRVSLAEVMRGFFFDVKGYKLETIHDDWVSQIIYLPSLNCVLSCCQHSTTSMFLGDFEKKKSYTMFKVNRGILCLDYCKSNGIIVTGGMDFLVRIWNPYVNKKAIAILRGHSKPITHIVVNSPKSQIISVDTGKNIRVFDMKDFSCIQKLNGRVLNLGDISISSVCFNPALQSLIIATNQLAILERGSEEENRITVTSHNRPVLSALYNRTFQLIVSVCLDSVVCVWDIRNGQKVMQFINAHKRIEGGIEIPVEISAVTFDDSQRRLITAARDGSVKVWNFNSGACLRTFQTPESLDVTGLISTHENIYVTGWCRVIHVYGDGEGEKCHSQWSRKHQEDILCMSYHGPNIIATGSYDGDIILWSRDTGKAYCTLNAFKSIKPIIGNKREIKDVRTEANEERSSLLVENVTPKEDVSGISESNKPMNNFRADGEISETGRDKCFRSESGSPKQIFSGIPCEHPLLPLYNENLYTPTPIREQQQQRREYDDICKAYEASIEKLLFLEKRSAFDKDIATLLSSGAEGWIRAWSLHHQGGLLGQFNASHEIGEGVHALATDPDNYYLFTGDTLGYLKIWDITEYCTKHRHPPHEREERWQYLIKTFTFLRFESSCRENAPETFTSRLSKPADILKRPPPEISSPTKTLKWPLLVNSFRAHTKAIGGISFVEGFNLICTNSEDCSIRLWTLGGQYIGTFGEQWYPLNVESEVTSLKPKIPRDLRRTGSAKTLKVLNDGDVPMWQRALGIMKVRGKKGTKTAAEEVSDIEKTEDPHESMGKKFESNEILGKFYKKKIRHRQPPTLRKLAETKRTIAVYQSLPFAQLSPVDNCQSHGIIPDSKTKYNANVVRDKLTGDKKKDQISALYAFINNKHTSPRPSASVRSIRMKNAIDQLQENKDIFA